MFATGLPVRYYYESVPGPTRPLKCEKAYSQSITEKFIYYLMFFCFWKLQRKGFNSFSPIKSYLLLQLLVDNLFLMILVVQTWWKIVQVFFWLFWCLLLSLLKNRTKLINDKQSIAHLFSDKTFIQRKSSNRRNGFEKIVL